MTAYGYARVSTNGQDLGSQEAELVAAGCAKVFKEKVSGAKTDRAELAKVIRRLEPRDVLVVTRLDRLARSTHDLLNVLATIGERQASFRSLKDTWADTATPHGRLMLTVLGGLAEFERELIRARTGEGRVRAKARGVRFGRPAVLSAHQRQEAIQRLANGEAQADLARSYGVSQPTISRLRRTILAGLLALPLSAQAQPAFYPETGQNPVFVPVYYKKLFLQVNCTSFGIIAYRLESGDEGIISLDGSLDRCIVRLGEANRLQQPLSNFMH
jgi:DNA invertase Pin-like site-specific DNA recombinase